jgi:hypothetical protein
MSGSLQAIDTVCGFEFIDTDTERPDWSKKFITEKIGADPRLIPQFTPKTFVEPTFRRLAEPFTLIFRALGGL